MKKINPKVLDDYRRVLSILEIQKRALQLGGSPSELISTYSLVLKFLKGLPNSQVLDLLGMPEFDAKTYSKRLIGDFQVHDLSLDEIEKLAADDKTPRRILEEIAIVRFHVPKGSMRSFQNMEMLREKILIRIQNERTHAAIDHLARSSRS
jgi:hypothetical protein